MKILAITPKNINGVHFHRLVLPYTQLAQKGLLEISFSNEPQAGFDYVLISRFVPDITDFKLKIGSAKLIVDCDDSVYLNRTHILYKHYIVNDIVAKTIATLKSADIVTTTTELLATELKQFNSNVHIIKNTLSELNQVKNDSQFIRFGFLGGLTHQQDLELLKGVFGNVKGKFVLIVPEPTNYITEDYYNILTNNGKVENVTFKPATPFEYLDLYKNIDYSLAPLVDNRFNNHKSELKIVEASATNTDIICSNVAPYKGIVNLNNSFLLSSRLKDNIKMIQSIVDNKPTKLKALKEVVDTHFNNDEKLVELYNLLCDGN